MSQSPRPLVGTLTGHAPAIPAILDELRQRLRGYVAISRQEFQVQMPAPLPLFGACRGETQLDRGRRRLRAGWSAPCADCSGARFSPRAKRFAILGISRAVRFQHSWRCRRVDAMRRAHRRCTEPIRSRCPYTAQHVLANKVHMQGNRRHLRRLGQQRNQLGGMTPGKRK